MRGILAFRGTLPTVLIRPQNVCGLSIWGPIMVYSKMGSSFRSDLLQPLYLSESEAVRVENFVAEFRRHGMIAADDVLVCRHKVIEDREVLLLRVEFHRSSFRFGGLVHGPTPRPLAYSRVKKE